MIGITGKSLENRAWEMTYRYVLENFGILHQT